MTSHDSTGSDRPEQEVRPPSRPADPTLAATPGWAAVRKFSAPDRVSGYIHRPQLLAHMDPTGHRVTVLKAPGGFGKTVLLAETFRNLRAAGTVVAWLTLADDDTPLDLDTCLAYAFDDAGLPLGDFLDRASGERDGAADFTSRVRLLAAAVYDHGAPCVLLLDELEQLADRASLALVNSLIQSAPANFHLAIACREIPAVLDIATAVFDGRAVVLTADDLKFSRQDIARFFGSGSSTSAVAALDRETSGWPIALRIIRSQRRSAEPGDADTVADLARNWIESRLFRDLSEGDRELLLDAALFDWIEADLMDEVLEQGGCRRRLESVAVLAGLFEAVNDRSQEAMRLHPLIREHCVERRLKETPGRFRDIHRRIAGSLARRGETVGAMRHAAAAGDAHLAGDILEDVGALVLWTTEGFASLQAADRLLTAELVETRPRLAVARCMVLLLTGQLDLARRFFRERLASHAVRSPRRDNTDASLRYELAYLKGMVMLYGCERAEADAVEALAAEDERILEIDGLHPSTRAVFEYALLLIGNLRGEFARALEHGRRAQQLMPADHCYHANIQLQQGQVAMAQGDVAAAVRHYLEAQNRIRETYLRDLGPNIEVFIAELNLERNRTAGIAETSSIRDSFHGSGTPIAACLACAGTMLDLKRQREGAGETLSAVEDMLDFARTVGLPLMIRYLAAERASALLYTDDVGAAERAWRLGELPDSAAGCLDLRNQTWREMEALSCIRLRLLTARKDIQAARELLHGLVRIARERNLVRTRMRALALGIALERLAIRPADAERHLKRFLRLYQTTDYARPIARDRARCVPALQDFLSSTPGTAEEAAALALSATLEDNETWETNPQQFSPRELDVLHRLESMTDTAIAAALGLTKGGVRYHVARLFEKLEVHDRMSAVARARRLGLLP